MQTNWLDYDTENCSIRRTLDVIGEKWTLLVLREAFNGVRRFEQIRAHTGVSDAVLSDRLRTLMDVGILTATPYKEVGRRTRNEYRLTERGLDLYPALVALMQWGDRHLADAAGPARRLSHRGCGEEVRAVVTCAAGHPLESAREGEAHPGPGARFAR